jgi:hypothetical protein
LLTVFCLTADGSGIVQQKDAAIVGEVVNSLVGAIVWIHGLIPVSAEVAKLYGIKSTVAGEKGKSPFPCTHSSCIL